MRNAEPAVTVIRVDELRVELEDLVHLGVGIGQVVDLVRLQLIRHEGQTAKRRIFVDLGSIRI